MYWETVCNSDSSSEKITKTANVLVTLEVKVKEKH